jgi:flagellar hook-associated protein 2
MSSSISPIFNGSSTFSADFNQVITRAVSIASLPITQLNSNVTTLTAEQTALGNLSGSFSSLQTAVAAIGTAAASGNYAVSYSDSSVASATAGTGALLGTYSLQVVDPGSLASAASTGTVTDPTTQSISSSATFTLVANGQTYANIMPTPSPNSLTTLVSAINTATQGAVQATIVNVGTQSNPSYQLSIQNSSYGALPITLTDDSGNNLLGTPTAATSVQYTINGQPDSSQSPLSSDSRTLALSPNLSVTVLKAGTTNITVGQSTSNIANALNSFVAAYNSASQALSGQRGSSGGALAGQSIVNTLSQSLHNLTNYGGTGSVQSIADLGLTFNDSTGVLSFDSTKLSATATNDFAGVTSFLGSPTTGGFLQAATNTLNGLMDATSGAIPTVINSIAGEITATDDKISTDQSRVDQMQTNLTAQISAADAAIASMQSQLSYMTSLFTSMTANQNTAALG